MDSLIATLFAELNIFTSGLGILIIGGVALGILLFWDWRIALMGLLTIQIGVAVLVSAVYTLPLEWGKVQVVVAIICTMNLLLSALQVRSALSLQRPGAWWLRLLACVLFVVGWRHFDPQLPLPMISPQIAQLLVWLALCAAVLLGFGDSPLYSCVAMLLWLIPVQVIAEILLPGHQLYLLIGIGAIFLSLACSYLMLTARVGVPSVLVVQTDNQFAGTGLRPRALLPANTNGGDGHPETARPAARRLLPKDPTRELPAVERRFS